MKRLVVALVCAGLASFAVAKDKEKDKSAMNVTPTAAPAPAPLVLKAEYASKVQALSTERRVLGQQVRAIEAEEKAVLYQACSEQGFDFVSCVISPTQAQQGGNVVWTISGKPKEPAKEPAKTASK